MSGKNSIQVAIKVRPLLKKEKDQQLFWRVVDNSIQLVDSQSEPFYFDHIFDQDDNNQIIFDKMAKQIVHSAIQGFNGTIFAYGQTSSGKTYTMMGDDENPGVMVLAAKEIFKEIERTKDRQFLLRVGYIEIYNEKIYDLLNKKNQDLKIHETSTGIISVNCEEMIIRCEDDLLNHLDKGGKERTVGETNMNERSSRSHAIFRIIIESRKMDRSEDDAIIQSVINLVDLAGSERADQTGARGARLKEGGHINKSLLFLSNVIKRLSENEEDKYISFRDSKLTRILQASLGGNALTAIICTIKPNAVEETQSTLSFALRAKSIKNKPQVNEIVSDATMMKRLEHEIKVLKTRLEEEQRKNESQIKVRQLEQRIKDEDLKIISSNSLHSTRNREKRRRTWCPSSNMDASTIGQPSVLPSGITHVSRLQAPKVSVYNTPLITIRQFDDAHPPALKNFEDLPVSPDNLPEIDEEFAPAELLSPLQTPRHKELQCNISITPKLMGCVQSTLAKVEHDLKELESFTNLENKVDVHHEPLLTFKHKVESLTQRNAELEKERLQYLHLKNELDLKTEILSETQNKLEVVGQRKLELENDLLDLISSKKEFEKTTESLTESRMRCTELQVQLSKLTDLNKSLSNKTAKYEAELADLKKTNETLELENREAVNLEFELKRHKNKAKLRENELLEALNEKDKEISKLEKSLNSLSAERLQNSKEELLQKSLNEAGDADEEGKVCIKCEDLQRLLEENKKNNLEFQKLTLEYENLKLNYEEIEKENELHKLKILSMEEVHEKEKDECEKLLLEVQQLKEQLHNLQQNYELLSSESSLKQEECLELAEQIKVAKQDMVLLEEKFSKLEVTWQEQQQAISDSEIIQTQFDSLQKEYDDLSNQLMDNLQECEILKNNNIKLKEQLDDLEDKKHHFAKAEAEINVLKSQLENLLSSERKNPLKTPSPCPNSSMRSSGVCVEEEEEERFIDSPESVELLKKFSELSESLTEIELEHTKGKTKLFKSASKSSTPNRYKMYLRNILGVRKTQKEFDVEIANIHLQGSFQHHFFQIVELNTSDEDNFGEFTCNNVDINGCENVTEYIEKLKQKILELNAINEQEQLNKKSILENTERALSEMREQITQLSAELLEKSIFVDNCACKTYQQQIENLEKEKADITIICEELHEKANSTLNFAHDIEAKVQFDDNLKQLEQLKQREQELLESFDSQTKTLEEITQRCVDMETELETAREQLKYQEKELKETYNQLQLENLQKLELSASKYRDNIKKYNKEWIDKKDEYEQIIKDLQNEINELKQISNKDKDVKIETEHPENMSDCKQNVAEKRILNAEETLDGQDQENIIEPDDAEAIKQDKYRLQEENIELQQQLNTKEEHLEGLKEDNLTKCEEITLLDSKLIHLEELLVDTRAVNVVLNRENSSLKTELDNIREDLNCIPLLHDKNQQLSNEMEKLNLEYSQLKEKLQIPDSQKQKFLKENTNSSSRPFSPKDKKKTKEDKRKLSNNFEHLNQENQQLCDKLQVDENRIEGHQKDGEREEHMQTLETKLKLLTSLEKEKESLANDLQNLREEYSQKNDKLLNTEKELEELKKEDANREEQLKSLETKLNHFVSLEEGKTKVQNEYENLEQLYKQVQEKLHKTEQQIEELQKENAEREEILKSLQTNFDHLQSMEKKTTNDYENLQQEYKEVQDKLFKTEEQIKEFHKEHINREELLNKLDHLKAAEAEKNNLASDYENLQQELKQVQDKLFKTQQQIQELCTEDSSREDIIQSLQNKLSNMQAIEKEKEVLDMEILQLKEKINCLQEKGKESSEEIEKLKQQVELLLKHQSDLECSEARLQKEKTELENKLEQAVNENKLEQMEKTLLKQEVRDLSSDLKSFCEKCSILQEEKLALEKQLKCLKEDEEIMHSMRLLTGNLAAAQNELEENKKCMMQAKEEKLQIQQQLQMLEKSLTTAIEEKNKKLEEKVKENEKAKQDYTNLHIDLKILRENIEKEKLDQQQKLKESKSEFAKLQQEHLEQKLSLDKAQEDRAGLHEEIKVLKESSSKAMEEKLQEFSNFEIKFKKTQCENQALQLQLKDLNAKLQQEILQHKLSLDKAQQHQAGLHAEIKVLKESSSKAKKEKLQEFSNLEIKFKKTQCENQALQLQLKDLNAKLQQEILQQKLSLDKAQQDQAGLHEEIKVLKESSSKAMEEKLQEFSNLEIKFKKTQCENQALQLQLKDLNAKLQQEILQQKLSLDKAQQDQAGLHEEIKVLKESSSKAMEEKLQEFSNLEIKFKKTQCENQALQLQLKDLNAKLQQEILQQKLSLDKAQQYQAGLHEEIKVLKESSSKAMEVKLQEFSNLEIKFKKTQNENQALQRQLKDLNGKLNKFKDDQQITIKENKLQSLSEENLQLSAIIETLTREKNSFEEKLRQMTVRNFEHDLQRQTNEGSVINTSSDSNISHSPKARRSLERLSNISVEEKIIAKQLKNSTTMERKKHRLSTHDERRRQSYWGATHDKETMTDPMDTSCNCVALDIKLKDCERNLFIKSSQVTALGMELKNHPLKDENASLIKRIQEERDKYESEIKRCKNKLYEQTIKTEKALAAAAHLTAKTTHAELLSDQKACSPPKVVSNVETQTDGTLEACIQKLQSKYNDLKNICRHRYNVIKDLEGKVAQKENADGNSVSPLESAIQIENLTKQCESLKAELKIIKGKYEYAKKVLQSRREETEKLRSQLE